jgi:hypothetical protein
MAGIATRLERRAPSGANTLLKAPDDHVGYMLVDRRSESRCEVCSDQVRVIGRHVGCAKREGWMTAAVEGDVGANSLGDPQLLAPRWKGRCDNT